METNEGIKRKSISNIDDTRIRSIGMTDKNKKEFFFKMCVQGHITMVESLELLDEHFKEHALKHYGEIAVKFALADSYYVKGNIETAYREYTKGFDIFHEDLHNVEKNEENKGLLENMASEFYGKLVKNIPDDTLYAITDYGKEFSYDNTIYEDEFVVVQQAADGLDYAGTVENLTDKPVDFTVRVNSNTISFPLEPYERYEIENNKEGQKLLEDMKGEDARFDVEFGTEGVEEKINTVRNNAVKQKENRSVNVKRHEEER